MPAVATEDMGNDLVIAGRLRVPVSTAALLFDMDGVLLDTLTLDYELVQRVLATEADGRPGVGIEIPLPVIRANFAYDVPEFWRRILSEVAADVPAVVREELVRRYDKLRLSAIPAVHCGIMEILTEARRLGLAIAVVSNNPAADVKQLLTSGGLLDLVDKVVGNDESGLAKKPAPDTYLAAARKLAVDPSYCAVIEDSLLGAQAGSSAGCFVVGVATGASSATELAESRFVSSWVESFGEDTSARTHLGTGGSGNTAMKKGSI